jgi:menaquinone-dependent protoporphyrinogen oxidase
MTVLVAYASKHGSTQEIAEFIAETLRGLGKEADCVPVAEAPDPRRYEGVILGSAVYVGSWLPDATAFARGNAEDLAERPVWLFSSGPFGNQILDQEEQPQELEELRNRISPKDHRMFFGALDMDKLAFEERMVVKAMGAPAGDFRDWDDIRSWTEDIASSVG